MLKATGSGAIWDVIHHVYSPDETDKAGFDINTEWAVEYNSVPMFQVRSDSTLVTAATSFTFNNTALNSVGNLDIDGNLIDGNNSSGSTGQFLRKKSTTGVAWETVSLGEVNTASNLSGDKGIYASKSGADLRFKSLNAGTNIVLTADSNSITINSTASGSGDAKHWAIYDDATGNPQNSGAMVTVGSTNQTLSVTGDVDFYVDSSDTGYGGGRSVRLHSNSSNSLPGHSDPPPVNNSYSAEATHPLEILKGDLIIGDSRASGYGIVMRVRGLDGLPTNTYKRVVLKEENDGQGGTQIVLAIEDYSGIYNNPY